MSNSVKDLADHLENLLYAGKDLWWYDEDGKKHPAVTPYMRAVIEEKIAMIRGGDYQ